MKIWKKVLCSLLVVVLCLTSAPLGGFVGLELPEWSFKSSAANDLAATGQCGDNVYWTFDSETGELVISGTGPMAEFNANLSPFRGVKSVIIENGVTTISDYIFVECKSLTSVTIGNSVTTIGVMAFGKCTKLTSITIPNSVTTIGNDAFAYCTNLTDITIPDSVTTISEDAFYGCDSITSVTIPDSVITIGIGAFADCDNLQCISVDKNSATYYSDDQGILFNKDKTILVQYPKGNKITSYTIPDTVTNIGAGAFLSCDSLTSITIPDSVITIGDYAFESCNNLTSVIIPDGVTTIGLLAFAGCVSLTSVKIPNSVTTIGGMAFMSCTGLTSITIPDSVTTIGDTAFSNCESLTKIAVDTNNPFYSNDSRGALFDKNKAILIQYPIGNTNSSYTIPDSVTTIVEFAFHDCDSLTSVTIPDSVTTIGEIAFYNCDSLTDVYYQGTEEQWKKISIGRYNDDLIDGTIHFNWGGTDNPDNPNDDKNSYINQHIDFVNGDTYEVIEYLRFANTLWDNMDNWLQNGAELAHDIIEGPLEIVSFQFLDGLECAANPYDTILLDFLASDVSRSYFVETAQEDALVIAMRIINNIIKMFDFDYKWAEKFDLKEELKSLIFASDYSGNQLYQALNTLFMGQSKKEIKVAFESFECFDKLFNYLEAGSSVLDFFVEMLRYVVAVEAFNNSSKYFRETLELISLSMYKVNTNYADKFEDTLSFYKESLTYDNIVDFVIENKGADGLVNLFYKMSTDLLSKATYSLIMSAFKVSSTVAGKINAALWSAEVGFGLSNLITGNDTKVNCRRLLRANYMFEIATYEVMETYKAGLLKKETTEAALYFDAGFNVFKATQIYSMDQYKKYCECTASKPLTIKKNYFKNEKEDIAGKIIAWQNIKCHSDDTKAVKIDTVVVECPTDIYVYRKSDNKLVASVIDNVSKSYSDEVSIICVGEEKALACTSLDDYQIEIVATDNGTMDVIYNSYSDFKNTKKLSFDDVPIKSGNKYELDDEKESIKRDDNVEYKTDGRVDNCSCNCHKGGIKGFFFKFLLFFQKIFRTNKVCKCGINHY